MGAGGETSALPAIGVVALITLAGLLLRLPSYGNSLFGDELSTYFIVSQHSLTGIVRLLDGHSVELTPPLFFLLARVVRELGSSPQLLRLVPLVAGTAAIPLTYALGLRTVGRRAALAGAALMALSPYLIFYSTEARAYALVMLLSVASTYCLVVGTQTGGTRWWIGYAVTSCAAMYTHYTAVFVLVAQLIWAFLCYPGARRALVWANLAAAIGFVPWLPGLIHNTHSFGTRVFELLEPFGVHAVVSDLAHWSIGHPYLALSTVPGTIGAAMILAGTAGGAAAALVQRRGRVRLTSALRSPAALPVLLALVTPIGLALYSAVATDTWDMRNLTCSWPGFALAIGALLSSSPTPARYVAIALTIAGFAVGATELLIERPPAPRLHGGSPLHHCRWPAERPRCDHSRPHPRTPRCNGCCVFVCRRAPTATAPNRISNAPSRPADAAICISARNPHRRTRRAGLKRRAGRKIVRGGTRNRAAGSPSTRRADRRARRAGTGVR